MSALEQRYNKLLAWYPEPFRSEQAGEMLGVLMAGAEQGQQPYHARPVVLSFVEMRSGSESLLSMRCHLDAVPVATTSARNSKRISFITIVTIIHR
jgi:hypothetical protein